MKTNIYIRLLLGAVIALAACNKQELEQSPPTSIGEEKFWRAVSDVKLFANSFYGTLPQYGGYGNVGIYSDDVNSDNLVGNQINVRNNGQATPSSGVWGYGFWANVRRVNYFLVNYSKTPAAFDAYKTYVGEAYFFRAWYYFDFLKNYGGMPWINRPLTTDDTEALRAPRLPRNVLADSILADLDKAISYLKSKGDAETMRINREMALAFKSRVALYEGTWEKYHAGTPFAGQNATPSKYLQQAADAAEAVINSGKFGLDNVGVNKGYWQLFNQTDYAASREVMFWRKYDMALNLTHNWNRYTTSGGGYGVTRSLVESYLCNDGRPISSNPLYRGDNTLQDVVTNRDPRLSQSIYTSGTPITINGPSPGDNRVFDFPTINQAGESRSMTGYQLYKGHSAEYRQQYAGDVGTTGTIYLRYAEVLLNYAEAKAELNTFTQADAERSLSLLRARVGMPSFKVSGIVTDPSWPFPALSPLLNEVRRERRVELALEGFRFDDICRWAAAGTLLKNWKPLGAKYKQWESVPFNPAIVIGTNLFLDVNGYIEPFQQVGSLSNGYQFNTARDYLTAIPLQEVSQFGYIQNPGW